ncbi:unknown [Parabacteroides sp. CAG:409]|nr:unknown [Parabacteroides sp. CAG:409]
MIPLWSIKYKYVRHERDYKTGKHKTQFYRR